MPSKKRAGNKKKGSQSNFAKLLWLPFFLFPALFFDGIISLYYILFYILFFRTHLFLKNI